MNEHTPAGHRALEQAISDYESECPDQFAGLGVLLRARAAELESQAQPVSEQEPIGYLRWSPKHGYDRSRLHDSAWGDDTGMGWRSVPIYTAPAQAQPPADGWIASGFEVSP